MDQPIGIFDSGVGGLTVAAAIQKRLPQESLLYYGDTRHAPYGDKSKGTITEYSRRITRFLLDQNCKAVVIACNTASAMAYRSLKREFPKQVLINVIDPVVEALAQNPVEQVGVIATRATIRSGVYARRIERKLPKTAVHSVATPLLAALIEEGFAGTAVSKGVLQRYLSIPEFEKLQALVLGCTHYPHIEQEIQDFFGPDLRILDSPGYVAEHLALLLEKKKLLNAGSKPRHQFYVSEKTPAFTNISSTFFGAKIRLFEKVLSA